MNESQEEILVGRTLHYVVDIEGSPRCRAAIVVEDWDNSRVNLVVFPDGSNDGKYGIDNHEHRYSFSSGEPVFGGPSNVHSTTTGPANIPLMVRWEQNVMPNHAHRAVGSWHWPRECYRLEQPAAPFIDPDTKQKYFHTHGSGFRDENNCPACIMEKNVNARR